MSIDLRKIRVVHTSQGMEIVATLCKEEAKTPERKSEMKSFNQILIDSTVRDPKSPYYM